MQPVEMFASIALTFVMFVVVKTVIVRLSR